MDAERRRRLIDERRLLEASLADAAAEHESGELDDAGLDEIVERESGRIAEIDAQLSSEEPSALVAGPADRDGEDEPPSRSSRVWLLGLGVAAIVLAIAFAGIALSRSSSTTGSSADVSSLLGRASALVQQGKVTAALPLYGQVLAIDPKQPEALAQSGWLTFEAGLAARSGQLVAKGEAQVRLAAAVAPDDYAPRLYLGVIQLLGNDDPAAALKDFDAFRARNPPSGWIKRAQPYIDQAESRLAESPTTTTAP